MSSPSESLVRFPERLTDVLCASASVRDSLPVFGVVLVFVMAGITSADDWPRFRGPNGDGQSDAVGIPSEWTEADYEWKIALPGVGHSSPVIWDGRLFVTSADSESGEQIVLEIDPRTGQQLWERRWPSAPHGKHDMNSFATSTPAVDAEQLYVAWMDGQRVTLAALTHDGETVWQHDLAALGSRHGFGTSPVVVRDVVCISNANEEADESAILGLDRATGDELWRIDMAAGKTAYATPCAWHSPTGETLLLMTGTDSGVKAFEPASGDVVWHGFEEDLFDRCVSSPIVAGGRVFISCGSGNNGKLLLAVRPGDRGVVPEELYRLSQGVPNVPTPVTAGDLLFLWHDRGTVACLDLATGETHWRERIGGKFHSSPIRIGERIFCTSLDGEVVVLAASQEYELLARNSLGEPSAATPAVADDRIYFRTELSLFCLGARAGN